MEGSEVDGKRAKKFDAKGPNFNAKKSTNKDLVDKLLIMPGVLAVAAFIAMLATPILQDSNVDMLIFGFSVFSLLILFAYSFCAVVYYFFRAFRGEVNAIKTTLAIVAFFAMWILNSLHYIMATLGRMQWSDIVNIFKEGYVVHVLHQGIQTSYVAFLILGMSLMLVYKSKRNPNSMVNLILYMSLIMGGFEIISMINLSDTL